MVTMTISGELTEALGVPAPVQATGDELALRTDRYELTMLTAARRAGVADRAATFELFARALPPTRRYGVVAGAGRLVDAIERFRFPAPAVAWLLEHDAIDAETADWLAGWGNACDVDGYPEGELWFPGSPVLTVRGRFGDAVLLETLALSILNHDAAIAAAASRMVQAAAGRPVLDMGTRRAHEEAAVAASRAAAIAGVSGTSNLAAGARYGLHTVGTAAHAFTLAFGGPHGELDAFAAQLATLGPGTTLLVDTYDIADGIRNAVAAARLVGAPGPGAVRIDSGDPAVEVPAARALLDELGATETRIVLTGDLDEHRIAALADVPVDVFGVGTSLMTGAGVPTCGFVYKLVEIADESGTMRPVAKRSLGKATIGGAKRAWRTFDADGVAVAEVVDAGVDGQGVPAVPDGRALTVPLMRAGVAVADTGIATALARHRAALAELAPAARSLEPGPPALPTLLAPGRQEVPR
jgi:nicotinate phosphoribosyltransferase